MSRVATDVPQQQHQRLGHFSGAVPACSAAATLPPGGEHCAHGVHLRPQIRLTTSPSGDPASIASEGGGNEGGGEGGGWGPQAVCRGCGARCRCSPWRGWARCCGGTSTPPDRCRRCRGGAPRGPTRCHGASAPHRPRRRRRRMRRQLQRPEAPTVPAAEVMQVAPRMLRQQTTGQKLSGRSAATSCRSGLGGPGEPRRQLPWSGSGSVTEVPIPTGLPPSATHSYVPYLDSRCRTGLLLNVNCRH